MYIQELNKIGLNKGEAEVYACLLQFGDLSASEIAKRTNIGRTNVYEYANALIKRGFASQYEKDSKIFFRIEDPLTLRDLVDNKVRESKELQLGFETLLPKLTELYNKNISKPTIIFLQGESGYQQFAEMAFQNNQGNDLFLLLPDLDFYTAPEPKHRNALLRKQIMTTLIANQGKSINEFKKRDKRELRQTELIEASRLAIKNDICLFEDYFAFGNFDTRAFSATVIQNRDMSKFLRSGLRSLLKPLT